MSNELKYPNDSDWNRKEEIENKDVRRSENFFDDRNSSSHKMKDGDEQDTSNDQLITPNNKSNNLNIFIHHSLLIYANKRSEKLDRMNKWSIA